MTHSSSNAEAFSLDLRDRGLDLLPNAKPGQSLIQTYLTGNTQRRVTPAEFQRLVIRKYRAEHGWVRPLPAARDPAYALAPAAPPAGKPNKHPWLSQHIQDVHLPLAQLVNALALLGAFALALSRRAPPLARRIAVLGLGTLLVLAFLRLSGTAAQAYNQERAFLQTMVPLSIALAWLLQAGAGAHRLGRLGRGAVRLGAAVALLAIYVNATGLRPGILGGGAPTNVADRGEDYERFYLTRPELAGARWLGVAAHNNLTYADRYGSLRVLGATGRYVGVLQAVTPPTLDRSAWIYASRANGLGRARGEVDGKYTLYAWPQRYLGENYATVYANGSSSVYHR